MRMRSVQVFFLVLLLLHGSGFLHYLHLRVDHNGRELCSETHGSASRHAEAVPAGTADHTAFAWNSARNDRCPVCDLQAATNAAGATASADVAPALVRADAVFGAERIVTSAQHGGTHLARAPPCPTSIFSAAS